MSAEQVHTGRLVAERYRLDELLGRGGYGSVYKGWDTQVGRDVAVKLLDIGDGVRSAEQIHELRERFRREAQAAQQINHRGIVRVFDFGIPDDGGESFLVMELLTGRDLGEQLQSQGPLGPERVQRLFVPMLEGLGRGHELGIVHKDIKPQNIYFCEPDTAAEALCLVDFGVARVMHEHKLTMTGLIVGTPQYLAPEYITDALVTPALDVYQMGLILVELITGTPAVPPGETFVKSCNRHFTGDLEVPSELFDGHFGEVLRAALEANPKHRIQTASEFARRLADVDPSTVSIHFRKTLRFSRNEPRPSTTKQVAFAPMSPAEASAELVRIERESGSLVAPPVTPMPTAQIPGTAPIRHAQPLLPPVLPPPVAAEPSPAVAAPTSPWVALVALLLVIALLAGGLVLIVASPPEPKRAPRVDTIEAAQPLQPPPQPLEIRLEAPPTTLISSEPPGARILLNGVEIGRTPAPVELGRAPSVELQLEGYEPATAPIVEDAATVKLTEIAKPERGAPQSRPATSDAPRAKAPPKPEFQGVVFDPEAPDGESVPAEPVPQDPPADENRPQKWRQAGDKK